MKNQTRSDLCVKTARQRMARSGKKDRPEAERNKRNFILCMIASCRRQ